MKYPKKINLETEHRLVVARGRGRETEPGGVLLNEYGVTFERAKRAVELQRDRGGCTL